MLLAADASASDIRAAAFTAPLTKFTYSELNASKMLPVTFVDTPTKLPRIITTALTDVPAPFLRLSQVRSNEDVVRFATSSDLFAISTSASDRSCAVISPAFAKAKISSLFLPYFFSSSI
jgi:hypothetical protein